MMSDRPKLRRPPQPGNRTRAEPWPHVSDEQAEKANWQQLIEEAKNG
jgi:hypothetical protein